MPRSRRIALALTGFAVGLALAAAAASAAVTLWLRSSRPPTTAFMLREARERPIHHLWVDWPDISPHVAVAVVASEDQKFPVHDGFDFAAIRSALSGQEERRLPGLRGASTISQQLAKNLFLWPGRSLFRKGVEAWFTLLLEATWPKRRILEVYLNVAEFGPGVFGIAAASEMYLGKPPDRIDPEEAARLAAVLPSPSRMRVADPGPYAVERAAWIREQVAMLGGPDYLAGL